MFNHSLKNGWFSFLFPFPVPKEKSSYVHIPYSSDLSFLIIYEHHKTSTDKKIERIIRKKDEVYSKK
jgi:hypothetical protein